MVTLMENKIIEKGNMDIFFRLRKPVSFAKVVAMVGWQIERFTEDKKKEFERSGFLNRLLRYPDTYHLVLKFMSDGNKKIKISIVHDVHKQLVFNIYKGDVYERFEPYFDYEKTAYSILIKPVEVDDLDWKKRQTHFLIEFLPYFERELRVWNLKVLLY